MVWGVISTEALERCDRDCGAAAWRPRADSWTWNTEEKYLQGRFYLLGVQGFAGSVKQEDLRCLFPRRQDQLSMKHQSWKFPSARPFHCSRERPPQNELRNSMLGRSSCIAMPPDAHESLSMESRKPG
eukprot:1160649-Pelagomonas_calceolata.AAC.2